MVLVDYSDSSEDNGNTSGHGNSHAVKKRRASIAPESHMVTKRRRQDESDVVKLPPLPPVFHDLYPIASRTSTHDDPSLHGGRKRAVPHVDGNWATHIYLEWHPTDREMTTLSEIMSSIDNDQASHQCKIHSLLCNELGAQLPLHISLSRSIVLYTDNRQTFSDLLERSITTCGVRPFDVRFADLAWVGNYEQTRWFLVLRLTRSADNELNRLLCICNEAARAFGQPLLYADPKGSKQKESRSGAISTGQGRKPGASGLADTRESKLSTETVGELSNYFHVSIAWTLERPSSELLARTRSVSEVKAIAKGIGEMCIRFDSVKLKVGKTVKDITLPTKAQESKGLIGS